MTSNWMERAFMSWMLLLLIIAPFGEFATFSATLLLCLPLSLYLFPFLPLQSLLTATAFSKWTLRQCPLLTAHIMRCLNVKWTIGLGLPSTATFVVFLVSRPNQPKPALLLLALHFHLLLFHSTPLPILLELHCMPWHYTAFNCSLHITQRLTQSVLTQIQVRR